MNARRRTASINEEFHSRLTTLMFDFMNDPSVYVTIHDGTFIFGEFGNAKNIVCIRDTLDANTLAHQHDLLRAAGRLLRRATTAAHIDLGDDAQADDVK